jgi:hypothetical protein
LAVEGGLQPGQHGIEGVGQLAQLVTRASQRDPRGQVVFRGGPGRPGDLLGRSQDPAGDDALAPHTQALLNSGSVQDGLRRLAGVLQAAILSEPVLQMRALVAAEAETFPEVAAD